MAELPPENLNNSSSTLPTIESLQEQIRLLQKEQQLLVSFIEAHDRMTHLVLDGHNFEGITNQLGRFLRTSVEVEDRFGLRLAHFTHETISDARHFQTAEDEADELNAYLKSYLEQAQTRRETVQIPGRADLGLARSRLVAPIMVERELLGYVFLLDRRGGFSPQVRRAIEHAALIYALLMMKQKSEAETERRLQASFLEDLIGGNFTDEASIINRGRFFGFNPTRSYHFFQVEVDDFARFIQRSGWDQSREQDFKRQLFGDLARLVQTFDRESLTLVKSENLIILSAIIPDERLFGRLREVVTRFAADVTVSIALGGVCRQVADFKRASQRAGRCLELARWLDYKGRVIDYTELGIYNLLFERENKQLLFDFAATQLHALSDYDQKHKTELVSTLQKYFQHGTHLKETACAANIHLSALKYRLRRIQEIAALDLDDPDTAFNLQLALKIVGVRDIFHGKAQNS